MQHRHLLLAASLGCALASGGAFAAGAGSEAQPPGGPSLELNRLEGVEGGCRMHLVVSNTTERRHDSFKLDLVVFDGEGVIARRVALDVSPVRPNKTSVYAFDVDGLDCSGVGRVLLNDVLGCTAAGDGADCASAVTLSSRAGADFVK
ncbi:MAG: Tat pathway signal sequence domain protein [Planctomycetota bacterium]|jgi:hypothetical protein